MRKRLFFPPTRRPRPATYDVYLCSGYVGYGSTTLPPKNHVSVTPAPPTQSQPPHSNRLCAFRSIPRCSGSRLFSFGQKCVQKKKTAIHVQTTMRSTRTRVIRPTATAFERVISYAGLWGGGRGAVTEIMAVPGTPLQTVPRKFRKQSKSTVVYADARKQNAFLSFRQEFVREFVGHCPSTVEWEYNVVPVSPRLRTGCPGRHVHRGGYT